MLLFSLKKGCAITWIQNAVFRWIIFALTVCYGAVGLAEAPDRQQQLDAACETARESKLAPERERYINECVAAWDKSREDCTHFYRDYGDAQVRQGEIVRAPLYDDLPECEKAWEFRTRYRNND